MGFDESCSASDKFTAENIEMPLDPYRIKCYKKRGDG